MWKFVNWVIYFFNVLAALMLLFAFGLPFLPPNRFPILSILSLGVPLLIALNIAFSLYWVIQLKKRFLLSFIMLVATFFYFNMFYNYSKDGDASAYENKLTLLSYNVRLFNQFENKSHGNVPEMMAKIIEEEEPEVIFIQEYYRRHKVDFSGYPYRHIHFKGSNYKVGYAIYSKYPLINKGAFNFPNTFNNTIYADVVKGNDTIRLYNMHLQSHGILPEVQYLQETDTESLLKQLSQRFRQQETQIRAILKHRSKTNHPVILAGDMNNTAFSYNYRKVMGGMQDAFKERGNGFGATFSFDRIPLRIDFIFASPDFDVISFKTIKETFSDHRAIRATFGW